MEDDKGLISGFIRAFLDAEPIYNTMLQLSSVATVIPWVLLLVAIIRVVQESKGAVSGKTAMGLALGELSTTTLVFLAYTSAGLLLFAAIFLLTDLFQGIGSTQLIHSEMVQLRSELVTTNASIQKEWYEILVEGVLDGANTPGSGLAWAIYQLMTIPYASITQLIEIVFAVGVAVIYVWGFIAIPTTALKGELNLISGWVKSVTFLAIWAILEPLLLYALWLLAKGGAEWLKSNYGGAGIGVTAMMMWHIYAIILMFLTLLFKVLAIFMAFRLAQNQPIGSELGGAAAVPTALALNQAMQYATDGSKKLLGQSLPQQDGTRGRDSAFQYVSDQLNAPVGDHMRNAAYGLEKLTNAVREVFTPSQPPTGGGAFENLALEPQQSATSAPPNETASDRGYGNIDNELGEAQIDAPENEGASSDGAESNEPANTSNSAMGDAEKSAPPTGGNGETDTEGKPA